MSSNFTYCCDFCRAKVEESKEDLYGKMPKDDWEKLNDCNDVDELLEILPEENQKWIGGDTSRISGSSLDYDFFESWGNGVHINKDGNMEISISGSCDLCGKECHFEIILPCSSKQVKIDLTKKGGERW